MGMIGDVYTYSGLIYGHTNMNNFNSLTVTDDSAAYLYPWYDTALVGNFKDNIMLSAKHSWPIKAECRDNFIRITEFEQSANDDFEYSYDPPTTKRASSHPMKRDPYEELNVEVLY